MWNSYSIIQAACIVITLQRTRTKGRFYDDRKTDWGREKRAKKKKNDVRPFLYLHRSVCMRAQHTDGSCGGGGSGLLCRSKRGCYGHRRRHSRTFSLQRFHNIINIIYDVFLECTAQYRCLFARRKGRAYKWSRIEPTRATRGSLV